MTSASVSSFLSESLQNMKNMPHTHTQYHGVLFAIASSSIVSTLVTLKVYRACYSCASASRDVGLVSFLAGILKECPCIRSYAREQIQRVARESNSRSSSSSSSNNSEKRSSSSEELPKASPPAPLEDNAAVPLAENNSASDAVSEPLDRDPLVTHLPEESTTTAIVLKRAQKRAKDDTQWRDGESKMSGTVYMATTEHLNMLSEVYAIYAHANPLHADSFPSIPRMEQEIIAMARSLLDPQTTEGVCGCVTSGGTESILLACKAARDAWCHRQAPWYAGASYASPHFRAATDVPEIIVARSAHAAFWKAASWLNVRIVVLEVDPSTMRLTAAAVRRRISRRTMLVVASAPCYPHGVVDDVQAIADLCKRRGIPLHVDSCLGGFCLPLVQELRPDLVPTFDFRVPGVTSISADTHKFGMGQKGTSVLLYRSKEMRKFQYTAVTEWSGGLYISPTLPGSRNGGVVATAWASLICLGRSGLRASAEGILQARDVLVDAVSRIDGLCIMGIPAMGVVAVGTDTKAPNGGIDSLIVMDLLTARGWVLNALQKPLSFHVCFTGAHSLETARKLASDLAECAEEARRMKEKGVASDGKARVYGLGGTFPDRGAVGDLLIHYQDGVLGV